MRGFLVFFAVVAAASAIPYKFDHDVKINVYDVLKSLYAAAPLSTYLDQLTKNEEFKFEEKLFHFYPEEEIKEALVVYKPKGEKYLHSYYFKVEDASKYEDKFYDAVRPIYEYINSGEYYAFTPYAAKKIVPEYFNHPMKEVHYKYYENVDLKHEIPVVFIVPKSEVDKEALKDLILIAEYEITKDGVHDVHEYFDNVGKSLQRRGAYFAAPYAPYSYYRTAYPYAYSPSYVRGYPYPYYYGYPDYLRSGHWHALSEHIAI